MLSMNQRPDSTTIHCGAGFSCQSPIQPTGCTVNTTVEETEPYQWSLGSAPLDKVANAEKMMPRDFISADGFGITDKCRKYLTPLIQGENPPRYENGLPVYVTLKNQTVKKKLAAFELA